MVTTAGEIEIELWGRECPKTVRNFIALSMEGESISMPSQYQRPSRASRKKTGGWMEKHMQGLDID